MGFRMRKSIKVGRSARINLSRSGIGGSIGTKGFRVGAGPRGLRINTSIPGTGIGYEMRSGTGRRPRTRHPVTTMRREPTDISRVAVVPPSVGSLRVAFLCWLFLGLVGGHRYYLGRTGTAFLQTITLGGLGLWWFADVFMLRDLVRSSNERRLSERLRAAGIEDDAGRHAVQCPQCGRFVSLTVAACPCCSLQRSEPPR